METQLCAEIGKLEKFKNAITHFHPHLDEIAVFFLIKTAAGEKASVNELKCSINPVAAEKSSRQAIGIGRGELDEHLDGENGRSEDSAFSIAIKKLGLENSEKAMQLKKFVDRTDSGGGKHPFDISSIVQTIHRCYPGSSEDGINWCLKALESIWKDPQYLGHQTEDCGKFFEQIGSGWLMNRFGNMNAKAIYGQILSEKMDFFAETIKKAGKENDASLSKLEQFFKNNCSNMRNEKFGLPRVIYSTYKLFGLPTAFRLAGEALDAKYNGQKNFELALKEIQNRAIIKQFGRFKSLYIETDNLEIQKAILYARKDVSVIIKKNPQSGHVQIFSNSKSGVRLKKLAASIRKEELFLKGMPTDEFLREEFEGAGNTCGLDNWCFIVRREELSKGSDMILNGSESHVGVEATKISSKKIKDLVADCLLAQ